MFFHGLNKSFREENGYKLYKNAVIKGYNSLIKTRFNNPGYLTTGVKITDFVFLFHKLYNICKTNKSPKQNKFKFYIFAVFEHNI